MERRQAICGILSVLTVGPLAGCGGDSGPLAGAEEVVNIGTPGAPQRMTLNAILDNQFDLTEIDPEIIDLLGTNFDKIFVEEQPVVY